MSGFGVVAGVVALFFACGILLGVLGVMALSAMRTHPRAPRRRYRSRYAVLRAEDMDRTRPRRPSGPDWEDRPGWHEDRHPDEIGGPPPTWPGDRRDLAGRRS